ncbi:MAG: alkaline phosphatase [Bacteroidales bacterium]|nr:alkaline phosphatase [Bacteroidales bacterium]
MSIISISGSLIRRTLVATAIICLFAFNSLSISAGNDVVQVKNKEQMTTGRNNRPVRPVKNIILMIPDGCSLATVSAARWYQWILDPQKPDLNIDPYICGTVRTYCSNAPIGDSAPTTSCYMTGIPSKTGFVSTYPPYDGVNDIIPVDSTKAYQPLMTVLEASKILYGKATGLVFTCEFPHATPADCSAHCYNRSNYHVITSQMVHNNLDVVIGGGAGLLQKDQQQYLKENGYDVQLDDVKGLRNYHGEKLWSLFNSRDLPYDLDRDAQITPSLEEMTSKAIGTLSKNKNGFFVMVEGSKVDWAAHANDPAGMLTEFLAFDRACKVALDFARKDGHTAVVILPDHGNSGISIGTNRCPGYSSLTKDQLFDAVTHFSKTSEGLADILNRNDFSAAKGIVQKYTRLELTDAQLDQLNHCRDYSKSTLSKDERKGEGVSSLLAKIMTNATCFGFTTTGHTGEDVFLAAYHPNNDLPQGVYHNFEINDYLCKLFNLEKKLPSMTSRYFAKHTRVFKGMTFSSNAEQVKDHPVLTVTNAKKILKVKANSNVVNLDGKDIQLQSVVVYVDKNKTFYLPESLADLLK